LINTLISSYNKLVVGLILELINKLVFEFVQLISRLSIGLILIALITRTVFDLILIEITRR
jgi:hypothetical protein